MRTAHDAIDTHMSKATKVCTTRCGVILLLETYSRKLEWTMKRVHYKYALTVVFMAGKCCKHPNVEQQRIG